MTMDPTFESQFAGLVEGHPGKSDADSWSGDEHSRYHHYLAAHKRFGPRRVIRTANLDPDIAMSEATIVAIIDEEAKGVADDALKELLGWCRSECAHRSFVVQRVDEWLQLSMIDEANYSVDGILSGSDWLQRNAVARATSQRVLESLANHGRTSKVRSAARSKAKLLDKGP